MGIEFKPLKDVNQLREALRGNASGSAGISMSPEDGSFLGSDGANAPTTMSDPHTEEVIAAIKSLPTHY